MEHTPGPWVVDGTYDGKRLTGYRISARWSESVPAGEVPLFGDYLGAVIAKIEAPFTEQQELAKSNAMLIAAAPDLLAAAQNLVDEVEGGDSDLRALYGTSLYAMFKDAIAKARGKE